MKVFAAVLIVALSTGVKISEIVGELEQLDDDLELYDAGADVFVFVDVEPEEAVKLESEKLNAEEESSDEDDGEEEILDQVEEGEIQDEDDDEDLLGDADDESSVAVIASSDSLGVIVEGLAQIEKSSAESDAESDDENGAEKEEAIQQKELKAPMLPLHK